MDKNGDERARRRASTPKGDYEATIQTIADLVESVCRANTPIGIGIPGSISPSSGVVKNANSTCLIGRSLDKDLRDATGRKVRVANDADCFTLSEAVDGAGAKFQIVFGIILGTGVGGGLAINKSLVRGPNAITGEWGHNPLPWPTGASENPGPECYCGKRGCIETFLSGPGFSQDHLQNADEELTAEEIVSRANSGEKNARNSLDLYIERLARASASVINVLDPSAIILGGGLSETSLLYDEVPKLWPRYVFSDAINTRLLSPPLWRHQRRTWSSLALALATRLRLVILSTFRPL